MVVLDCCNYSDIGVVKEWIMENCFFGQVSKIATEVFSEAKDCISNDRHFPSPLRSLNSSIISSVFYSYAVPRAFCHQYTVKKAAQYICMKV